MSLAAGPTRVDESIALCEEIVGAGLTDRQAQALALLSLAYLYALRGDFERARESCLQGQALLNDLGIAVFAACTSLTSGRIELLADDPAAAEVALRNDYAALGELGERYFRPVVGALLARALVSQDKIDDAARIAAEVRETAAEDDVEAQAIARSVQARVAAARGEEEQALRLADEAIAIVGETDALVGQGDALVDLALVLASLGHAEAAAARLKEAVELYGRRAATTPAQQAQELLDGLDLPSKPIRAV
jgi:tetratricopeptide (TPR) repeat protein